MSTSLCVSLDDMDLPLGSDPKAEASRAIKAYIEVRCGSEEESEEVWDEKTNLMRAHRDSNAELRFRKPSFYPVKLWARRSILMSLITLGRV